MKVQTSIVGAALLGALAVAVAAGQAGGWRMAALVGIGVFAGLALYHASFGFTAAWRRFFNDGRTLGIRAQLVMLGATVPAAFFLLGQGSAFGQPIYGFVNPVGPALGLGAFLFGIGMQLGGGCGSGTLYTVGGGSTRMGVTLAAFIAGSLIATADPLGWMEWPALAPVSLVSSVGWPVATALALALFALGYRALVQAETRRHGAVQPLFTGTMGGWLTGPWPLVAGALALALVNLATFLIAGRPWGITQAFALWGAKMAGLGGLDVGGWRYWQGDASLGASVFADGTSVMNFGLMLGALAAAGLAGKFAPVRQVPLPSLLAALVGGLLMGVGARLGTGCNIGAFFSGLASGSLHGLVWLIFALPGNWIGARLRPAFKLE